ncbi:hypothetical protein LTS07_004222 [Exophiala sideris]|uniref:Cytochrome P450 n=1 Tax=Exophiala sideris TaxID=1016849 RepID=A0ABR0JET7_9EURO|nr:hypothetical protein LTS07_004222 [Exophiala sideris]KAK5062336.1 hypothetical protein LTR69_004694 [Exophiala sideris]KAK5177494.1 hypothetical protein LTR44_009904 [Eurotiomycetes sp. CCFEE 6388]
MPVTTFIVDTHERLLPGWPVIGNALEIPKTHAWLKFTEWADEYGPIYQIQAFGTTLVIISKESIANDLLGLRGAIYSDRPALVMPRLISDDGFLGAIGWTDYWRRARRFTQSMLSTANIQQSVPKQTTEARQMVVDLAKSPSRYAYWLERAGVMTSVKQIYGLTEERGGHAEERHVHEIVSYMEEIDRVAVPGAYLVEFIPALLRLPTWLAPFKREAKVLVRRHWEYFELLMQQKSKKHVMNSDVSFARRFLKSKDDWGLSDREIVWVLSSIYGGASGTSATAMQSIILNTCLFPEWQQRIQNEIDEVVGGNRLPDMDDFASMPTVRAVIKESMRWRPVLSGGFPHAVTKDDVYEGYHIPKGAIIIPNQWAILREEQLYPDADSFKPERWLEPKYPTYQEPLTMYPNLKRFAGFGHGRRICPGLEVTEKSLFLQMSNLYWACNITRAKDENGREVDIPWYDYTGVAISTPHPFRFAVEEREEGRLKMMEQSALTEHEAEMTLVRTL